MRVLAAVTALVLVCAACSDQQPAPHALKGIVPAPVSAQAKTGVTYNLTDQTKIYTADTGVGEYLAELLRRSTGYALPVSAPTGAPSDGISLLLAGAPSKVGQQGYELDVNAGNVVLRAQTAAGLFSGVQTLRQLLPPKVESAEPQSGPWTVPGAKILDYPRFGHRSAMLDVVRHFRPVEEVKEYIDQIAMYKINYFHWHLTNDQGWRIEIESWPRLAEEGGATEVGGGPGGYYTKDEYREIVDYAAARHITVVPEIDIPGHTNSALSVYAELNCDDKVKPKRTDTAVGYSSLCVGKDITYDFVDDVVREVAEMTPGPYFHIGGDEANATSKEDYQAFMDRTLPIVKKYGKKVLGWHEFIDTTTDTADVPQYWGKETSNASVAAAVERGHKVLMSPSNKAYLDMKYHRESPLGLDWAGHIEVRDAYDWDPATQVNGIPEAAIIGIESPLWAETVVTYDDVEFMAFPRLPAYAELGWSPRSAHSWESFAGRLGAHAPRWEIMDINYYRSPQVPWEAGG